MDGALWLKGAPPRLHANGRWFSVADGSLMPRHSFSLKGIDDIGPYIMNGTMLMAVDAAHAQDVASESKSSPVVVVATVKMYTDSPHIILFETMFPDGANATAIDSNVTRAAEGVASEYPVFLVDDSYRGERGFLSWQNHFFQNDVIAAFGGSTHAGIGSGLDDSGPLAIFARDAPLASLVSAASNFMTSATSFNASTRRLAYGVLGSVTAIPPGFNMNTIAVAGTGVTSATAAWGAALRDMFGKDAAGADPTLTTLQYITDHGAYYYYHTEPGTNYQETLEGVKQYAEAAGIPYRNIQIDSYFYPKANGPGLKTGYAQQNGGQYAFAIDATSGMALPLEQVFWDDLMANASAWLTVYEQDWLYVQTRGMDATRQSATLARDWLLQMGNAAAAHGIRIQYCMPYPRHLLQSVEIAAVDQIRASGDEVPGRNDAHQWQPMGTTALLAHALGLAPSKDNFWSTVEQPGNPYKAREAFPRLQAAVATLSTGPVAIGDRIGYSDVALILRSVRTDGIVLAPSRPATLVDSAIAARVWPGAGCIGQVWATSSELGPVLAMHHVFAANVNASCRITPAELGSGDVATRWVAYESNSTATRVAVGADGLLLEPNGEWDFALWHLAPALPGSEWTFLGEADKWVPASPARFRDVNVIDGTTFSAILLGAPGEIVTVAFAGPPPALAVAHASCTIGPGGVIHLMFVMDGSGSFKCA
ncbi:6 carbohydrate binding protein [Thecamonas trahens ATCC 50062]|uniref:6 carbohydrate binding protein n=1 Tax=Thecamonas trahens ATCC 50062 TaxID=461836 RepID=A0A0L0DNT2_THETB|nr:6 carbohydrate binding protein [Thecamonas trahens ATCC 50062]KNC53925.1 6 carbohydrate binding protein [Thecamonas trahens ATCC 50062]|eukprot:XP_013754129.1 6 carbohydrate binding protein [Thecamonas trahens ATCC 50062]